MNRNARNLALIGAFVSIIASMIFHWWFQPSVWMSAGYLLLGVLACLTIPLAYRLFGYGLLDDAQWLLDREAAEHREMMEHLDSLKLELAELEITEGSRQAEMLTDIIDDYHSVVETRFVGKKHSPLAYLSTARRVQKHALQNLADIVAVGHSLSSISRHQVDNTHPDNDKTQQRQERHSDLHTEQTARIEVLLDENRKLFDALTETAVEVANIQSFSQFDRIDTLARLVGLAEITSHSGK